MHLSSDYEEISGLKTVFKWLLQKCVSSLESAKLDEIEQYDFEELEMIDKHKPEMFDEGNFTTE